MGYRGSHPLSALCQTDDIYDHPAFKGILDATADDLRTAINRIPDRVIDKGAPFLGSDDDDGSTDDSTPADARPDHRPDLPKAASARWDRIEETDEGTDDAAYGKPEGRGNGKNDTTTDPDGTPTKVKGWGRFKDNPDEPTGGDTGTTDDTATNDPEPQPDPEPTPTPEPEPTPTPAPAPEPDPNTYVSGSSDGSGFNIELVFQGDWAVNLKSTLMATADEISTLITGDLPDVGSIDDIRITASLTELNGFWGYAGHGSLRPDTLLPSTGYMQFDPDPAATYGDDQVWADLVFHEMMHALGFGTAWNSMGLVENYGGDLRFTGDLATAEYLKIAPDADTNAHLGVPVETDGGSGKAGVHWDEGFLDKDIMSTTLEWKSNVYSDLNLAALEDMGYETIYPDEPEEDPLYLF